MLDDLVCDAYHFVEIEEDDAVHVYLLRASVFHGALRNCRVYTDSFDQFREVLIPSSAASCDRRTSSRSRRRRHADIGRAWRASTDSFSGSPNI